MERILPRLKVTHLIPPVLALVTVCVWNTVELRTRFTVDQQISVLQGEIATATASAAVHSASRLPLTKTTPAQIAPTVAPADIDWQTIPSLMDDSHTASDKAKMLALAAFQKKLETMSREEMVTALDNLASLNLSPEERRKLESAILDPLIEKDPEYALARFADRIASDPDGIGWQLGTALREWAKKDLTAASNWLDRQIAEGKFLSKTLDGNSEILGRYEASLMETLLSEDPAAAARRLAGIPEDQRREILQQLSFEDLGEPEQQVYADLVRGLVPEVERQGTFADIGAQLAAEGGYEKVSAFLDAAKATPTERAAAAAEGARSRLGFLALSGDISPQDLASLEPWLAKQAPQNVGKIVGKALAEAAQNGGKFSYENASKFILKDQRTRGTDESLLAFLKSYSARSNLEQAADLIDRISDPVQRETFRKALQ
jgi:hypothetical protein